MLSTIHKLIEASREPLKSKDIQLDTSQCFPSIAEYDNTDNPFSEPSVTERNIYKQMKYERNRLYSFQSKWPLQELTPESLAGAGLFYLQHEDTVQCPFCFVKISNWTFGDNPLREHMRRRPKCPFLMGCNVGNIPISHDDNQQFLPKSSSHAAEKNCFSHSASLSYKPKHPIMADVKKRILTYSGWPLIWLTPQQLAECGLFYSGIVDVVTCFFCGGSLGNWEPNDDPWDEHAKFFPNCAFLSVTRNKKSNSPKVLAQCVQESKEPAEFKDLCNVEPSSDITSDIIREAQCIFPESMVLESVKRKGGNLQSLQELCDDILESKKKQQEESSPSISEDIDPKPCSSASSSQALLCVICMDRERGVAYQPCGHFVSCPNCANLIANCPVCRRPITQKIRIYHT